MIIPAHIQDALMNVINATNTTFSQSPSASNSDQTQGNENGFGPSGPEVIIGLGVLGAAMCLCLVYFNCTVKIQSTNATVIKSPGMSAGGQGSLSVNNNLGNNNTDTNNNNNNINAAILSK
ncbi:MAG: hypothetical protein WC748_05925 [Legionellales bacterium]